MESTSENIRGAWIDVLSLLAMATLTNHFCNEYPDVIPANRIGLLNVSELAKLLNISPKTVYAYVSKGLIPFIKIESNVRFSPQAIRGWLQKKAVPAR